MKRFRLLHLALLLIFAGVIVGVQFHSHAPGQDQLAAHCKSCHISQTPFDLVSASELSSCEIAECYQASVALPSTVVEYNRIRLGRAPPVC